MTRKPRRREAQGQRRFDWSIRSNQLRDVFRDIRLRDHQTRWLLAYIDNRIGGDRTSWDMTIAEIVEETQLGRTTVYERLRLLQDSQIISVDDVPHRPQLKRFTISRANISETAHPDHYAVREADDSVRHMDETVREADCTYIHTMSAPSAHGDGAFSGWRIDAAEFRSFDAGLARYEEAVHFGWIGDSDADRLNWLTVWEHLRRRHAEGGIKSPGAALTARLKSGNFKASEQDQQQAEAYLAQRRQTVTAGSLIDEIVPDLFGGDE